MDSDDDVPVRLSDFRTEQSKRASTAREVVLGWNPTSSSSRQFASSTLRRGGGTSVALHDKEEEEESFAAGGKGQLAETRQRLSRLLSREKQYRSTSQGSPTRAGAPPPAVAKPARVVMQSPAVVRQMLKETKKAMVTRSLSPSPRKRDADASRGDPLATMARKIDSPALKEISEALAQQTQRVLQAPSVTAVRECFAAAQADLHGVGISQVQLWIDQDQDGYLAAFSSSSVAVTISPETMLQVVGEHHQRARELYYSDTLVPATASLHADTHQLWPEVERAMRLVGPEDTQVWHSIHVVTLPSNEGACTRGALLVSEAFANSTPLIAMNHRTSRSSAAQLKTAFLLECLERLAMAVSFRFHQLQCDDARREEQAHLARALEDSRLQTRRLDCFRDLDRAEDVHHAVQIVARFACATVGEAVSEVHCWVLFPPSLTGLAASAPRQPELHMSGCRVQDGIESTLAAVGLRPSSITNRLVANAGSAAAVYVATRDELETAGLVRVERAGEEESFVSWGGGNVDETRQDLAIVYFALNSSTSQQRVVVAIATPTPDRSDFSAITTTASVQTLLLSHAAAVSAFATESLAKVSERHFQNLARTVQSVPSILWSTLASSPARAELGSGIFHQTCRALESNTVSSCFRVRSVKVVLVDDLASALQLCPAPVPRTARFFLASSAESNKFSQLLPLAVPVSSLPWMQDLYEDRPVLFAWSDDVYMSEANRLLQDLVLAACPDASTCALLPLKTTQGLCLLVLVDQTRAGEGSRQGPPDGGLSVVLKAVEHARLVPDLVAAVTTATKLHAAEFAALEAQRRDAQLEALTGLLQRQAVKTRVARHFSTWKSSLDGTKAESSAALLSTAMDLLSPDLPAASGEWGKGSLKNFLLSLEGHITRLFPLDSISIMTGLPASIAAPRSDAEHAMLMTADDASAAAPVILVGFVRVSLEGGGSGQIVGTIRVVRSARSDAKPMGTSFSTKDTATLSNLCRVASTVYSALRRGLHAPKAEGDAKGLLLPFMSRLLPFLLEGPRRDADSLRAVLPLLAQFIKLICGGDVALLRIRTPDSADRKELLVSSEDYSERLSVPQFLARLNNDALREASLGYVTNASLLLPSGQGDQEAKDQEDRDGYAQIVLKMHEPHDSSLLGEIKVLGPQSPEGFDSDQLAAAQLISYIFSHSLSTALRMSKSDSTLQHARDIIAQAEAALDERKQDFEVEKGTGAALRKRLSAALAMVLFVRQASESSSVAGLAAAVAESFPLVVGSRNAVLLLHEDLVGAKEEGSDGRDGLYAASHIPGGGDAGGPAAKDFVSFAELQSVPTYAAEPLASQSKMLLSRPAPGSPNPTVYGAILLFGQRSDEDQPSAWKGLEDVLAAGLACAVEASLDNMAAAELRAQLEDSHRAQGELQEDLARERTWKVQHDVVAEQMRGALQSIEDKEAAAREAAAFHGRQIAKMQENVEALQRDLAEVEEHRDTSSSSRDALVTLIEGFSFDHRSHQETIPTWLHNYAAGRDCVMVMVTQGDDGTLSGAAEEIRGVTGAAGEALRTGSSILIHSSVGASSALLRRWPTLLQEASEAPSALPQSAPAVGVSILCVPNKCISLETRCDHACYVFLRPSYSRDDSPFSEHERILLVSAANLASRLMLRSSSKYSVEDLRAMELEIQHERALVAKIRHAVLSGEALLRRPCRALADVGQEIEACTVDLLSRGEHDSCSIACKALLLPPDCRMSNWHDIQADLQGRGTPAHEIDLILRACQAGSRGLRKAGTMWTPLKAPDGQILAILRTERKLVADVPARSLAQAYPASASLADSYNALSQPPAPSLADLLITEEEEEAVAIFGRQAAGHLSRVAANIEACDSMDQAAGAMGQLQGTIATLEERLQLEGRSRSGLEGTLRAGIELLGACCSKRFTVEQLLDIARKSLLAITASQECFIVLPRMLDVFPVPQSLAEVIADGFYCLEADRALALRVRFDAADMEFRCMQTARAAVAPNGLSEGPGGVETAPLSNCWAARRYLGRAGSEGQQDAADLSALAVPFALQDGSLAVIASVRLAKGQGQGQGQGAYLASDRDAVAWVAKVLAYCLEMICGKGSIKEGASKIALLEAEIARLRVSERLSEDGLEGLRADCRLLLQDLLTPPPAMAAPTIALDYSDEAERGALVMQTARLVFAGLDISSQSAAEAGQSVELLPWEAADAQHRGCLESDSRGVVESSAGKATYWVGRRGEAPMLVVLVNHRGYPTSWLNISCGAGTRVGSTSLRVAMLLRLLDCQESWCGLRLNCAKEMTRLSRENELQSHDSASALLTGRASLIALAAALHACQEVRSLAQAYSVGKEVALEVWMQQAVRTVGTILAPMDFELAVAIGEGGPEAKLSWFLSQNTSPWTLAGADLVPVQTALATGQTVVIGPEPDESLHALPEQHAAFARHSEALQGACAEAGVFLNLDAVQTFHVLPLQSSFFQLGSVVVPVRLSSTPHSHLLLVLRRKKASRLGDASLVASILVTAVSLGMCLRDAICAAQEHRSALSACRRLAISRAVSARTFVERHRSFALLKDHMQSRKLAQALARCDELGATRRKLRQMEQSIADWAEMARGLNGASGGIAQGVTGLWFQACRILMSMVSSHVTLRGCGLCIENSAGDVVEYAVRGLSTPNARHHAAPADTPDHEGDYSRGSLDCRPVAELGGDVAGLVAELLQTGPYTQSHGYATRSYPRLHKLARGEYDEEQTWLVPVRTSRSILAVLRVAIVPPRASSLQSPGHSLAGILTEGFPSTPASPSRIRFADVVSPLGASGGGNPDERDDRTADAGGGSVGLSIATTTSAGGDESRAEAAQIILLNFAEVLAPLIAAARALDHASIASSQQDDEIRRVELRASTLSSELGLRAATLSDELALLAAALGVVSDFVGREDADAVIVPAESLVRQLSEALGAVLGGGVTISLGASAGLGPVEVVYRHPVGCSLSSVSETIADAEGRAVGRLLVSMPQPEQGLLPASLRLATSALKPLCRALGGVFRSLGRHRAASTDLADKRATASRVPRIEADLARSKALVSVLQQCIAFVQQPFAQDDDDGQVAALLQALCSTLPPLLSAARTQVSFALVEERVNLLDASATRSCLDWVSLGAGEADGATREFSGASADMVENIARACLSRRLKSLVDVCDSTEAVEPAARIRVLTYPLLSGRGAVGVMQVLSREDIPLGGPSDGFCDATAEAVSCVVATHQQRQAGSERLADSEAGERELVLRLEGVEANLARAQRQADGWRGVAAAAALVVQGVSSGRALADVVSSEAAEALREAGAGLGVVVRVKPAGGAGAALALASDRIPALVPVGADLLAEVSCEAGADAHDGAPLAETLRSVLAAVSLSTRAQEMEREARRNDAASAQLAAAVTEDELQALSTRCAEQADEISRHDKELNFSLGSMSSFCGPTIREIAVMLEELGSGRRLELSEAEAEAGRDESKGSDGQEGGDGMDWAWDGLARVADRALSRISDRGFGYHASVLVRRTPVAQPGGKGAAGGPQDLVVRMFDSSRRRESLTISNSRGPKSARLGVLSDPAVSTLEKALLTGGVHENPNSLSQTDLVGIEKQALSVVFDAADPRCRVQVLCVAMPDAPAGTSAVLRVVFPSAPVGGDIREGGRSLVRPVMEMVMSLGCAVILISGHLTRNHKTVRAAQVERSKAVAEREGALEQLARARRMHRVVCREACSLLDPPLVGPGGQAPRAVHPASLTPLAASQDACSKLLHMSRSLLRGEGQALLLRDPTTDPVSFQVIFSGSALTWAGVEQGSFGTASSARQLSLAEAAMHSHKPVAVDDGPTDPRYSALLDGACDAGSPMLFVPIRGRGSAVIGCLISTRGRGGAAYNAEDVAAAEIVSSHGSLTLYWCQGLGSLHHILSKNVTKMEALERAVGSLASTRR